MKQVQTSINTDATTDKAYQSQMLMSLFLTDKLNSAIRRAALFNKKMNDKAAQTRTAHEHCYNAQM